jgi:hypothetical protein
MSFRLSWGLALVPLLVVVARGDSRPGGTHADVSWLPPDAAQIYADTTLFPRSTKWLENIPWLLDLKEGLGAAKAEGRPILIWVSGDDPLERC